jgi:alpha-L-rhamnosidase
LQGDLYHLNDPTPLEFINLCYYGLDIRLMMLMANIHQGPITFLKYKGALSNIIEELNKKYLNPNGSLKLKSQTAHVLALRFGLLNPEQQQQVAKDLVALIRAKRGPAHSGVTTGILGTKELLTVLARNGYPEEAVAIIQSRKFPSLGFGVENGANTIWERGTKADDKDSSLSFAHPVHGTTSNWLISGLAGISAATPGFHAISLEPTIPSKGEEVEPIRWVRAHYDSLHGRITVHWERRKEGGLLYEVTIPADTTAVLKLPAGKGAIVTESGKTPDAAEGVTKIDPGVDDGRAYFQLLSGSYRFEVK